MNQGRGGFPAGGVGRRGGLCGITAPRVVQLSQTPGDRSFKVIGWAAKIPKSREINGNIKEVIIGGY